MTAAHNAELIQQGGQIVGVRLDGLDLVLPWDEPIQIRGGYPHVTGITVTVLVDELTITNQPSAASAVSPGSPGESESKIDWAAVRGSRLTRPWPHPSEGR